MKKFFFSILAVGAIAACTKSEVQYEDAASQISFAPVASTATKAVPGAVQGTAYLADETFYVWAYWQDIPTNCPCAAFDAAKTYINQKEFKKENSGLWEGKDKNYYWPKTGSLTFACLSPVGAPVSSVAHNVTEDKFTFNYNNSNKTDRTVDLMWSDCTLSHNEITAAGGVPVTFNHALAWITFKVAGAANDAALNGGYKIESLTINNVNTTGSFDTKSKEWSIHGGAADYDVFNSTLMGSADLTAEAKILENGYTDQNDNRYGQPFNGTIVIPQFKAAGECYQATLVYTNTLGDEPITETVYLDLGQGWEIGKHYTYYINFSSTKEIQISPSVVDWVHEEKNTSVLNRY